MHNIPQKKQSKRRANGRAPWAAPLPERKLGRDMRAVPSVPRKEMFPGNVLLVRVPFADGSGQKIRPAIVLKMLNDRECQVLPVTTSPSRQSQYYPKRFCLPEEGRLHGWVVPPVIVIDRKLDAVAVNTCLTDDVLSSLLQLSWVIEAI